MADNEDEVLVEIEGEGQTEDSAGEVDPVAEIKRQYEALEAENKKEREAAAAANRRAADERAAAEAARKEAAEAKASVADSQLDTIVSGIAAAQAEAEAAEKDYASAAEAGDFKKQAEAQRRMARAESRVTTLEGAKADLEARKTAPRSDDQAPARRASDPFEAHVSKFSERTAQWMRDHRDWITDPKKEAKVQSAHFSAVAEGLAPDTDEYFEHVETAIGLRQNASRTNGSGNGQQNQQRTARRSSPVVAPVNGGAGAHSSGAGDNGRNTVYLTKGEAKAANDGTIVWNYDDPTGKGRFKKGDPIGNQEMARRKQEMSKRGYYDRSYSQG